MSPNKQRELNVLLDALERSRLLGDIGRMIFLAVENATDERDHRSTPRAFAGFRSRTARGCLDNRLIPT